MPALRSWLPDERLAAELKEECEELDKCLWAVEAVQHVHAYLLPGWVWDRPQVQLGLVLAVLL